MDGFGQAQHKTTRGRLVFSLSESISYFSLVNFDHLAMGFALDDMGVGHFFVRFVQL